MVQLLAPCIDHESHSAQRHTQTDRQTDRRHADAIADHTRYSALQCCVIAVRSAKNEKRLLPEIVMDCT